MSRGNFLIIESEKIKFKPITQEEREIYLKRLLRFKYPPDKKRRVFGQILAAHTIEPKIGKKTFDTMKPSEIDKMVSLIWNYSCKKPLNNKTILENDVRCFNSKKMLEDMLGVELEDTFDKIRMQKISLSCGYNLPEELDNYDDFYISLQNQYPLVLDKKYLSIVNKVILVEGATEEILLPEFARLCKIDFGKEGFFIIASGGKSQVLKDYLAHRSNLNLPIFIVLDNDAKEQYESILSILRENDKIFLLQEGEFEDLLCPELILKALNKEFKNLAQLSIEDLSGDLPMTHKLCELFKMKGLGEFKKVEFAKMISRVLTTKTEIGSSLKELIKNLAQ